MDARIIVRTILVVLKRDGISNGDHATMPRFTGGDFV